MTVNKIYIGPLTLFLLISRCYAKKSRVKWNIHATGITESTIYKPKTTEDLFILWNINLVSISTVCVCKQLNYHIQYVN